MSNAIDFLKSLPGPLAELTAIHPTNGKIKGRSFDVKGNAEDRAACEAWIADGTAKGYGIYFNVNSLSPRTSWNDPRKAAKENVTALNALHVDADVSKDITDRAAFAVAKAELLRSIRGMNKPPTIIVDSGNGYGLFWVLRKPVTVTTANLDQLTAVNIALRDTVRALPGGSADACQNLDRVMRLPYTTNFPNATKIERGCVVVPTDLISDQRDPLLGEVLYSVEDFEAAPVESPPTAPADNEAIDIPDKVDLSRLAPDFLDLIRNGPKKDSRKIGGGSRSAVLFSIGRGLVEAGYEDGEIVAILSNPDNAGPAAHIWREGRTRTPEAQAIKTVQDLRGQYGVKPQHSGTTADEDFGGVKTAEDKAEETAELARLIEWTKRRDKIESEKKSDHRNFLLYLPGADKIKFIYTRTGSEELWSATSVNLTCKPLPIIDPRKKGKTPDECEKIDGTRDQFLRAVDKEGKPVFDKDDKPVIAYQSAANWIKATPGQHIAAVTWWPGKPTVIRDTLVIKEGGVIPQTGKHSFNRYREPRLSINTPSEATRWLDHVKLIYPLDWQHIVNWLAWRVQHPDKKIMHALILGGATRIGKDRMLAPVSYAIGPWNFGSTNAQTIMDEPKFTPYLESVICLIHEAKDFGDQDRYAFYHRIKPWLGGEARGVLMCADKNVKVHAIIDVFAAIITTNHKLRGLYIPPDDARLYFAWSNVTRDDIAKANKMTEPQLDKEYFVPLQEWYESGGFEAVAHYLRTLDLTKADFSPTAPPPKTDAWREVVAAGRDQAESTLERILEGMGNPAAVSVGEVRAQDEEGELDWWSPKGRTQVAPQMETAKYIRVLNDNKTGRWMVGPEDKRVDVTIYARAELTAAERRKAALEVFEREAVKARKVAQ